MTLLNTPTAGNASKRAARHQFRNGRTKQCAGRQRIPARRAGRLVRPVAEQSWFSALPVQISEIGIAPVSRWQETTPVPRPSPGGALSAWLAAHRRCLHPGVGRTGELRSGSARNLVWLRPWRSVITLSRQGFQEVVIRHATSGQNLSQACFRLG